MSYRNTMSVGVVCAVLASAACHMRAEQTNTLESMQGVFNNARTEIDESYQKQRREALARYGKALQLLMQTTKKKGDIDSYLGLEAEFKRFEVDQTVPGVTNVPKMLADTVLSCHKGLAAADAEKRRRLSVLVRQYTTALDGLVKRLMAKDKISDAKLAKDEKDMAVALLAGEMPVDAEEADVVTVPGQPKRTQDVADLSGQPKGKKLVPKDAKALQGHHYLLLPEKRTWRQAKEACAEMGGHLVSIEDKEEDGFVRRLAAGVSAWIGLTDEEAEGTWKWVDGTEAKYFGWREGQPDNHAGNQDYVCLGPSSGGAWDDYPAQGGDMACICEWDY